MKFAILLFTLGAFLIASCSAACTCSASDQKCLDKCVMTANSCIETCKMKGSGNSCQESCIASNWPSMPVVQKDVLNTSSESGTSSLTVSTSSGMPTMDTAATASTSMMKPSLSGANPSMSGTLLARPSGSNSNLLKEGVSSTASHGQILSAVGMVTVMAATFASYFF